MTYTADDNRDPDTEADDARDWQLDVDDDPNWTEPGEGELDAERDFEAEDYGYYWSEVEQGMYDDDPSPYAGDYSEM